MNYSLKLRMALGVSAFTLALLSFTALTLYQAYERTLASQLKDSLQVQIYGLIAAAEYDAGQLDMPFSQFEPRLNQPGSGLNAWVLGPQQQLLWRSLSVPEATDLADINLDNINRLTNVPGEFIWFRDVDNFYQAYSVVWEGYSLPITFIVWDQGGLYLTQLAAFRDRLVTSMIIVAMVLALAVAVLMAWSLHPLQTLVKEIEEIDKGQQAGLGLAYPQELSPVANSVNLLLQNQQLQRQRYRNTLADLAHSLKTPLAVLTNELHASGDLVQGQLRRMQDIITYQLNRAVKSGQVNNPQQVNVGEQVQRILQTLNKAYFDKNMQVSFSHTDSYIFNGDQQDLLELLGNILENAYKYGRRIVEVSLTQAQQGQLCFEVGDDGDGFGQSAEQILQRGVRGDTVVGGQGIGLSVAVDIIDSYLGKIHLGDSRMGGAKVTVNLPGQLERK